MTATMTDRIFNFSAGPAVLPEPVLKQAQKDLWNIHDSGIGILEHSHRGEVYSRVLHEAIADWRDVGNIPDDYEVLFIQGGASLQFAMIPMNFLHEGKTADYFDTGKWAHDAIEEAKLLGSVNVACSSADRKYSYIPDESQRSYTPGAAYVHYCANNTIAGTEVKDVPNAPEGVPIICDASSNIFCRPIDVTRCDMWYGGAQKNLGPSGCAFVIASKKLLETCNKKLPKMLRYDIHAAKESRYNTPNTFAVYLMGQTFKWIRSMGGLEAIEKMNIEKARILYDFLDASDLFEAHVPDPEHRSIMNVSFRTTSPDLDAKFCAEAEAAGLANLKGHRSVGGMRASIYNAFPIEGVRALVEFMKKFELENR